MTLTTRNDKINKLADRIEHCENIDLFKEELPPEYYYSCIPLCLLDAVYSIGVRYSSTRNVVKRYCDYYNLEGYRDPNTKVNSPEDQHHTIKNLIDNISYVGPDEFAESIVKNRQRTSSRNGILKSEAVLLCAVKLEEEGVQTISDFNRAMNDSEIAERIEGDIRQIKGQTSGLSFHI